MYQLLLYGSTQCCITSSYIKSQHQNRPWHWKAMGPSISLHVSSSFHNSLCCENTSVWLSSYTRQLQMQTHILCAHTHTHTLTLFIQLPLCTTTDFCLLHPEPLPLCKERPTMIAVLNPLVSLSIFHLRGAANTHLPPSYCQFIQTRRPPFTLKFNKTPLWNTVKEIHLESSSLMFLNVNVFL